MWGSQSRNTMLRPAPGSRRRHQPQAELLRPTGGCPIYSNRVATEFGPKFILLTATHASIRTETKPHEHSRPAPARPLQIQMIIHPLPRLRHNAVQINRPSCPTTFTAALLSRVLYTSPRIMAVFPTMLTQKGVASRHFMHRHKLT